jgi:hypothetical protein
MARIGPARALAGLAAFTRLEDVLADGMTLTVHRLLAWQ